MIDNLSILLAEDEPSLGMIIKESLESRGMQVTHELDGDRALNKYLDQRPDLLILDIMLPKMDGLTLARKIRKSDTTTPILFLTSKSRTEDVLEGFHAGGNEYIKKPFSMEELIVRIKNLVQRTDAMAHSAQFALGSYTFDFPSQKLIHDSAGSITMTHRESQLLYHLYQKCDTILDRSFILNKLWGTDDFFAGRSLDVFISRLRKKLKHDPQLEIINVRGQGYILVDRSSDR